MYRLTLFLVAALVLGASSGSEAETPKIPASHNQIIKLTDSGISPTTLQMRRDDSFVFVLNATDNSLATLELDYGGRRTHCASSNIELGKDGVARSKRPIAPQHFAVVCFPDKGAYDLTIYGLRKKPDGLKTKIIVE